LQTVFYRLKNSQGIAVSGSQAGRNPVADVSSDEKVDRGAGELAEDLRLASCIINAERDLWLSWPPRLAKGVKDPARVSRVSAMTLHGFILVKEAERDATKRQEQGDPLSQTKLGIERDGRERNQRTDTELGSRLLHV
jgi:hypothetical protein